jgi:YVTN family beta-propeller protein
MLRRLSIVLVALVLSCSSQVRSPDGVPTTSKEGRAVGRNHSQIIVYARSVSQASLPAIWEIRKLSLNRPDGTQVDIPGSSLSLNLTDLERGQKIMTISEVEDGNYTGLTIFTRSLYQDGTIKAYAIDAKNHTIDHNIRVVAGDAKTLIILIDIPDKLPIGEVPTVSPRLTIEDENPRPMGKLVYVANELSSNISVIHKDLKRVVYNVFVGTKPYALGTDHRRNRLYIADRKDGVIYEMDMIGQRLLKANQLEFVDEPVHIETVPVKDLFIVVNFGTNTLYLIDSFTLQIIETIEVDQDPVNVVYSVYHDLAFVLHQAFGTISVIDLGVEPAVIDTTLEVELEPTGMAMYEAEEYLMVSNTGSTELSVIDLKRMGLEKSVTIGIGGGDLAFDPFGRRLYIGMVETNQVLCVDPFTDVIVFSIDLPGRPGKLLFDDDEKELYVALPDQNTVVVIDSMRRKIKNWIETGYSPSSIAFRL